MIGDGCCQLHLRPCTDVDLEDAPAVMKIIEDDIEISGRNAAGVETPFFPGFRRESVGNSKFHFEKKEGYD